MDRFLENYGTHHSANDYGRGHHHGDQCAETVRSRVRHDWRQFPDRRDRQPYVHRNVQELQRGSWYCSGGGSCPGDHSIHLLQRQAIPGAGGNAMNKERINKLINQLPTHVIILFTMAIWIVPTVGLLITSLRPPAAVGNTGWWTVFAPQN